MVGGPVSIGDLVHVDFTTDEPTVVAPGRPYEAQLEELEQYAEPMMTYEEETSDVVPDQIEVRPPDYTSGSGGGWIPPATSGSFFPATDAGMSAACEIATNGYWIILPPLEIPGSHPVYYGVTLAGYSEGGSILTGSIAFYDNYRVRDVQFVKSLNASYDDAAVYIHGNGYFYNCEFTCENYGSGLGAGIANTVYACSVVFDHCSFGGADYGIWGNPNGGWEGYTAPNRYQIYNYSSGSWGWHVEILDDRIIRFHGEDSFAPGEWAIDSVAIQLATPLYSKPDGAYVRLVFDAPITGHGEYNIYSWQDENGHSLEDMSWIVDYGGTPNPNQTPEIPVQDEGAFDTAYGSAYTQYGPGATLTKTWYYQDYGLGSTGGSAGNQSPRTSTNWNPPPDHQSPFTYFWLTRWMGNTTGSDSRLNQNGYDLDLRLRYAYVYDLNGWKQWIAPTPFFARLYQCDFATDSYNIVAQDYCHIVVDGYTYKGLTYSGTVTLDANLGIADFSSTAPSGSYPGQLWYPIDGII
jgi:hypothetical protein